MLHLGIIREGKVPSDARAPLTPSQCAQIMATLPVHIVVQPSPVRCFKDDEYRQAGIEVTDDLSGCSIILGVKEVPVSQLLSGKTYLFFSHTIKKQHYNRTLLQTILAKNICLIDYEAITDDKHDRLVAFGFYAGVVGAHNAMWTYGKRSGTFTLPRLCELHDYAEAKHTYKALQLPPVRIALAGGGRVASGAIRNLHDMGIRGVSPRDFLKHDYDHPVFTQLHAQDYVEHHEGQRIFNKQHFYAHGEEYRSIFAPYAHRADIFINAIYYDPKAPRFFEREDMTALNFSIQVVGDLSCDIMPDASVPCTLRPSSITDPVYGFDPQTGESTAPFSKGSVDVVAIDNLPSELPRDASEFFGRQLIDHVLPEILHAGDSAMLHRATICSGGTLNKPFEYLQDYVHGSVAT